MLKSIVIIAFVAFVALMGISALSSIETAVQSRNATIDNIINAR